MSSNSQLPDEFLRRNRQKCFLSVPGWRPESSGDATSRAWSKKYPSLVTTPGQTTSVCIECAGLVTSAA